MDVARLDMYVNSAQATNPCWHQCSQRPAASEVTELSKIQQVPNFKELCDVYILIQLYNRRTIALLDTGCDTSIIGCNSCQQIPASS